MSEKDLYKILGVQPGADDRKIRAAYRSKAKLYHPDTGEGSSAEKFREIQDAYEVLSNAGERAAYDQEHVRSIAVTIPVRRQSYRYSAPTHIDLNDVLAGSRARHEHEHHAPRSEAVFFHDLEDLLRFFDTLDAVDW